jgi:hypothetical protein
MYPEFSVFRTFFLYILLMNDFRIKIFASSNKKMCINYFNDFVAMLSNNSVAVSVPAKSSVKSVGILV